jgi:hypothetical protein
MDSFVNTGILFNPVNWIIVTLVLIFGSYGLYVLYQNQGQLLPTI